MYYHLAEKAPERKDKDGKPVPVHSHGQVYTDAETICRVTGYDYDKVVSRVRRIAALLNEHGEA